MQPYIRLTPTHPANQVSQHFPLGFPVEQPHVHYQGIDTGKAALNGTQPCQFEAFTLDVDKLTHDQATVLSNLYREHPRLVSQSGTDREILDQVRFLAKDVLQVTYSGTNQLNRLQARP